MRSDRNRRWIAPEILVPASMLDIVMLTLTAILVNDPAFHVRQDRLPSLREANSTQDASAGTAPHRIDLRADGSLLVDDKPVELDELASELRESSRPVRLEIQVTESGGGAVAALLEIQRELSRAGVWERVRVPYKARAADRQRSAGKERP